MNRVEKILKVMLIFILILTLILPFGGVVSARLLEEDPNSGAQTVTQTQPVAEADENIDEPTTKSKDSYQFEDSGVLKNLTTGTTENNLFNNILKEKQNSLMTEVQKIVTSKLSNSAVTGGIYTDSVSLWSSDYDTSTWKTNTSSTTIYMENGSFAYKIVIPPGDNGKSNQAIINNAIAAVDKYKDMVRESVYVGLMSLSFNVYSMIPDKQLPVMNILEPQRGETGNLIGGYQIKSSGTGVRIEYSLKDYYHAISGKVPSATIGNTEESIKKFIAEQIKGTKFDTSSTKEKVDIMINSDFTAFYSDIRTNGGMYTKVQSSSVVTSNGVKSYTTTYSRKQVIPESRIDGTFPLALPSLFVNDDINYKLAQKSGYKLDTDISLLLSNSRVYKNSDGNAKEELGDFSSFGIDLNGIAIVPLFLDKDGKPTDDTKNSTKMGVIVPLWFKEAIANTATDTGELNGDDIYFTGRVVKFNNDYTTKTKLGEANKDLLAVDTKITGRIGIEMRRYAFTPEADYKNRESHVGTGTKPETFSIQTHFESNSEADYRGFVIYRNNYHLADDSKLIDWLKTEEAKAMTDVNAERLIKLITGEIGLDEDTTLNYEHWVRMQEIKSELDVTTRDKVTSAMNIVSIVLGYMIIIYSIFLSIAYWFDVVNVFVEFSLLKLVTGGRLYAIPNKDALDYVSSSTSGENIKYVVFWQVFLITLIGVSVGLTFIFVSPIIKFILWLYYLITGVMGV